MIGCWMSSSSLNRTFRGFLGLFLAVSVPAGFPGSVRAQERLADENPKTRLVVLVDGTCMDVLRSVLLDGKLLIIAADGTFEAMDARKVDLKATEAGDRGACRSFAKPDPAAGPPSQPAASAQPPHPEPGMAEPHDSAEDRSGGHGGASRLSAQPIPLAKLPARPKPLLELGSPFLGTGNINRGFRLPTGAVWQPSFLLFGTFRTGASVFDDDSTRTGQWANRLDLFGNLYLSGTERFIFGIRPLDETTDVGSRRFTGALGLSPDPNDLGGGQNGFNFDWDTVTHLFFEGEIGEIFPNLDRNDKRAFDLGFSVGRQPINFQEGLLINDFIDAVGITRNNLRPKGTVNLRITGLYAWNQINRNTPSNSAVIRNREADGARMFGLFTETDWRFSTVAIDAVYVDGGVFPGLNGLPAVNAGDGVFAGISFVQRFGTLNSSFRLLGSIPVGSQTPAGNLLGVSDPASGGALFFSEISWTPHHSLDLIYINGFAAFDDYRAAALDPTIPGPLARAGFLFSGPGLGNFPGALSPTAGEVVGGAAGYQKFFGQTRQQLLIEGAGRFSTEDCPTIVSTCGSHSAAAGARYQFAVGRRSVFVFEYYTAWENLRGAAELDFGASSRVRIGSRVEWLLKF